MGDVSQLEAREGSPYISAVLNPKPAEFQAALKDSFSTCLEIGCGVSPRSSWRLDKDDVWVGCDPAVSASGDRTQVHLGAPVDRTARMFVFSEIAAEVPEFKPDFLVAVAPNPRYVVEDKVINEDLEKFLDSKKPQYFLLVLDNRTFEAEVYLGKAKQVIKEWMKEHGFNPTQPSELIRQKFRPNSNDLGAFGNTKMCFLRTPGRAVRR